MLKTAIALEHPRGELRWLAEDSVFHTPFVGAFMNRIGAVRACQENAERLLAQDKLLAVFPEGVQGIGKLFAQRYQLQRFGRGGYVKLALRTGAPIVPTAIVGAEEASPMLLRAAGLGKALGLPYVPITPTFPLLGPLGLAPLPTRWRIVFGEPVDLAEHGPGAADDAVLVSRVNDGVKRTVQAMVDRALSERRSVFLG
jgi:1-acyl-sn-glycerol-3-phosphate acyltransferase